MGTRVSRLELFRCGDCPNYAPRRPLPGRLRFLTSFGMTSMDTLLRDLSYLLRSLRSARAFSAVVVLTIAVAVGASTALFSVVDPLLLRAEPFRDAGRLMALWESPPRADGGVAPGKNEVSPGTYVDWSAER